MLKHMLNHTYLERSKEANTVGNEIKDAAVPGLSLQIRKTRKTWVWRYNSKFNFTMKLGTFPDLSIAEARETVIEMKRLAEAGIDPRLSDTSKANIEAAQTLNDIAALYFAEKEREGRKMENYKNTIQPLLDRYGHLNIHSFTKLQFKTLLDSYVSDGKLTMANRIHSQCRSFLKWCAEEDYIETSPITNVRKPLKSEPKERRHFSTQEIRYFWNATYDLGGRPWGPALRLLLLTGCRLNEVLQMRRSELEGDEWTIPSERVKNKRTFMLFLPDFALEQIKGIEAIQVGVGSSARPSDLMFSYGDNKVMGNDHKIANLMRDSMNKQAECELPHWTFHTTRRTVKTGLSRLKVEKDIRDRVLNHAKGGMDEIYDQYDYEDEKREAWQRWADRVEKLVS